MTRATIPFFSIKSLTTAAFALRPVWGTILLLGKISSELFYEMHAVALFTGKRNWKVTATKNSGVLELTLREASHHGGAWTELASNSLHGPASH